MASAGTEIDEVGGLDVVDCDGCAVVCGGVGKVLAGRSGGGRVDNDHVWPTDPTGRSDLTGRCVLIWCRGEDAVGVAVLVAGAVALFACTVCTVIAAILGRRARLMAPGKPLFKARPPSIVSASSRLRGRREDQEVGW